MLDPAARLRAAVVSGNLAITKRLLARFPELWLNTDPTHDGWCNLHYASFHGHYLVCFHLVSVMRQAGRKASHNSPVCDLDLETFGGYTVLHMPLHHHHLQTLHFLLQEFASKRWLNHAGGPMCRTPLHESCAARFADGLTLLLEFGADWSATDANGDTCLHLCFAYGDLQCAEALLTHVMAEALLRRRQENSQSLNSQNLTLNLNLILALALALNLTSQASSGVSPRRTGASQGFALREQLRAYLHGVLAPLESAVNLRGQIPISHAASFEMERNYAAAKRRWVDRAVDDEYALRHAPPPISASLSATSAASGVAGFDWTSPGLGSLAGYGNFASISRTSLDSDVLDPSSPGTVDERGGEREGDKVQDHIILALALALAPDSAAGWTGRKHLRSLPNAIASSSIPSTTTISNATVSNTTTSAELDSAELSRPSRKHAQSFASSFRGSPLMTRPPAIAQNTLAVPISPLQVEFTSTQSRRLSMASLQLQARPSLRSEVSDAGLATPPMGTSFGHAPTFSPVSVAAAARRQSFSSMAAPTDLGPLEKDGTNGWKKSSASGASVSLVPLAPLGALGPLGPVPTPSLLRSKASGESLRRNLLTPAKLATAFRTAESPAAFLRHSRRPSGGESPIRVSPARLVGGPHDSIDTGSPRAEPQDDTEKKFVFAIANPPLMPPRALHQTSLPNLRMMKGFQEKIADDENHLLLPRNVRSISFARVREE